MPIRNILRTIVVGGAIVAVTLGASERAEARGGARTKSKPAAPAEGVVEVPAVCDRYGTRLSDGTVPLESLPFSVLIHYRQTEYQPVDPIGDYALAWHAKITPVKIFWQLSSPGKPLPPAAPPGPARDCAYALFGLEPRPEPLMDPEPVETEGISLEGHRNPIRVANMVRMLAQVIHEERARTGLEPRVGSPHAWSGYFRRHHSARFFPYSKSSKLLIALARGETAKYLVTGAEDRLEAYILSRPRESVTLHELFRASYRLNRGDVYLTLLTIENVLARHWQHPGRHSLAVTRRLTRIINHYGPGGDTFGSWYHLFGVMLYGYVEGEGKAKLIGWIESVGSHILSGEDETQEDFINREGGKVGARLRRLVEDRGHLDHAPNPGYLDPGYYLDLNEDFAPRLKELLKGRAN